jgi:hypothetical protein
MTLIETLRKRWLAALAMATAAVAVGAIFASPHAGQAATQAAPTSTATPTISGTPQVSSTLTASQGTWTDSPTSFSYAWSRCDANGDNCVAVAGATASTYTVQSADAGSTLRVTVTATNGDGSGQATSAPTAVITATAANGCPSGTGTIQVADLAAPARLQIDSLTMSPGVVSRSSSAVTLKFRVTACGGRPVQGAAAFGTPVPYNQFSPGSATSGADGFASMTLKRLSGFPAARRQHLLAIFARASKPGEQITAGVSIRRLAAFHVRLG